MLSRAKGSVTSIKGIQKYIHPYGISDYKLDYRTARIVKDLLTGKISHQHTPHTLLTLINTLIQGYGVEYIYNPKDSSRIEYAYINMGDTYDTTVIWDYTRRAYYVSSYGDIIERDSRFNSEV